MRIVAKRLARVRVRTRFDSRRRRAAASSACGRWSRAATGERVLSARHSQGRGPRETNRRGTRARWTGRRTRRDPRTRTRSSVNLASPGLVPIEVSDAGATVGGVAPSLVDGRGRALRQAGADARRRAARLDHAAGRVRRQRCRGRAERHARGQGRVAAGSRARAGRRSIATGRTSPRSLVTSRTKTRSGLRSPGRARARGRVLPDMAAVAAPHAPRRRGCRRGDRSSCSRYRTSPTRIRLRTLRRRRKAPATPSIHKHAGLPASRAAGHGRRLLPQGPADARRRRPDRRLEYYWTAAS